MMNIDLADPGASVTALRDVQSNWLKLASKRFAAVPVNAESEDKPVESADDTSTSDIVLLDLSGVACPMNFVKTKIKLTMMPIGSQLDEGSPLTGRRGHVRQAAGRHDR